MVPLTTTRKLSWRWQPESWERRAARPEDLVRNLDEAIVEQLKARARDGGRSLQAELKHILEQAARPAAGTSRAAYRSLADEIRAAIGDRPQADSTMLLAEDRTR